MNTPSGLTYGGGVTTIMDSNGNTGSPSGFDTQHYWLPTTTTLRDNTGIGVVMSGGNYSTQITSQATSRAPLTIQYVDTTGSAQTITINYYPPRALASCQPATPYNPAVVIALPASIVYPDGSNYAFGYQADGQLTSMKLPTGGTISYNPGSLCLTENNGGYVGFPASVTRTTPDGTTTYSQTATPVEPYSSYEATSTTSVFKPDGSSEQISFVYDPDLSGTIGIANQSYETAHVWYGRDGSTLKSTMKCYNGTTGDCTSTMVMKPIVEIATTTTVDSVSSQQVQFYNAAGQVIELDEYDFGTSTPTRIIATSYVGAKPGIVAVKDGNGVFLTQTIFVMDHNTPSTTSGLQGHVAAQGPRMNVTQKSEWLNTNALGYNNYVNTNYQYDDAGRLTGSQDPNGAWTYYTYDPNISGCIITTTPPTPVNGVSQATSATCDPNEGFLASQTDANLVTTSFTYDNMLRSTRATSKTGGQIVADVSHSYSGASLPEVITTTVTASPSADEVSTVTLDSMGRTSTTIGINGAEVDTTYDAMGRMQSVSNPYFGTGDPTYGITSFLYDGLGRKTYQCQADNTISPSTFCNPANSYLVWTYMDNSVLSRDEVGNQSKRFIDGLGRLTTVLESSGTSVGTSLQPAPSVETDYSYNVLNNLVKVTQWGGAKGTSGSLTRSFTYDNFSRLLCASNPESASAPCPVAASNDYTPGTVGYSYDNNGNVKTRIDARGIQTNYNYDALNRLTLKTFYDGTRNQAFGYDGYSEYGVSGGPLPGSTNAIGRLSSISNQTNAASKFGYDLAGRLNFQAVCLPSDCASYDTQVTASYDLAGNMLTMSYPDGHAITQTPDKAGRPLTIGDGTNTQAYLEANTFHPDGSAYQTTLGNGIVQTWTQNKRLQTSVEGVTDGVTGANYLSHAYCYSIADCPNGAFANNGNLWQVTDSLDGTRTQSYTYDTLNRIRSVAIGGVPTQQYSIDPFGNLSPEYQQGTRCPTSGSGGCTPVMAALWSFNNNQISNLPCGSFAPSYDASGNQLCDTDSKGAMSQYSFDAESRIAQISTLGNTTSPFVAYTYGADGARVHKQNADGTFTEYVSFNGQTIAEKDQTGAWKDYVFVGGKRIARIGAFAANLAIPVHQVIVRFGNDSCSLCIGQPPGQDRNLQVDSVTIGSTTIWSSDASVSYAGGFYVAPGGVWGNGDLTFALASPLTGPISVSAYGTPDYGVYPHMQVLVDGALVGEFDVNGSSQSYAIAPSSLSTALTTHFFLADHLGSAQLEFSANGTLLYQTQFMPFGGEINPVVTADHYKFTGKERDTESGLDYFGARYYGSNMGRWMSPDPSGLAYADPTNPQSLNLYSYVLNNPLSFVDPDGLECVWDNGSFDSADDKDTGSHGGCSSAGGTYVDPKAFSTLGAGDWSSRANSGIASVASTLSVDNNFTNVTVNANGSGYTDQTYMNMSNNVPYMLTNDTSHGADPITQLATQVTADSNHYIGCIAAAEGVGGGGTAAYQSGQPTNPKPFAAEGAMPSSSPASEVLSGAANKLNVPRGRYPSPVGGPGTGMPLGMRTTPNAGRAAARWLPVLGLAADAYAAAQLWNCLGH